MCNKMHDHAAISERPTAEFVCSLKCKQIKVIFILFIINKFIYLFIYYFIVKTEDISSAFLTTQF